MDQNKFPNNTISWLVRKVENEPDYLSTLLGSNNYEHFKNKHGVNEAKHINNESKRSSFTRKLWADLNKLSEQSTDMETKDFAEKLIVHLRKTWKAEKMEFEAKPKTRYSNDRLSSLKEIEGKTLEHMCSICCECYLDDDIVSTADCNHMFHQICLETWLDKQCGCPLCRTVIKYA